ncbi:SDR family NAD(P)-dependent oxidoreductase [Sphingobacterium rhinopitheci]|uniref:SDR family NAD(P)-dependent oxidoreductase n=1 Tax=Sphingobacterium rhinopitheci TaxID=2781960 RepID=UPI001F5238D9|nr:SDR family oxidoreductase [Sphingobacterium rhinopitheci]MCI0921435.1 SDR family oxidoreductase [Sphingobacterium rhinopitheci]
MFEGKTVIISGGVGGIGFATAQKFALLGANIALGDIKSKDEAKSAILSIEKLGVKCMYTALDISNAVQVKNWIDEVHSTLGLPTLIIVNAAITRLSSFQETSALQWEGDIGVNVNGAFYMSKYATELLKENKEPGRVVFVGSWAAQHVHSHMPSYSVSKAAVQMLNKCLALELAPYGILVNEIAPGYVDAGLSGRIWDENPGRRERAAERVPTKTVITAEEVAENIIFLCNPLNRHMVGSTLLMDGGLSLQ